MVASEQHLYQTIVLPRNLQQEVYMITFLLLSPIGYSIRGNDNYGHYTMSTFGGQNPIVFKMPVTRLVFQCDRQFYNGS